MITLDDDLIATAKECSGISDLSELLSQALCMLVARDSARRLAREAAKMADHDDIPRRRFEAE